MEKEDQNVGRTHVHDDSKKRAEARLLRRINYAIYLLVCILISSLFSIFIISNYTANKSHHPEMGNTSQQSLATELKDGKDVESGLLAADGYMLVKQSCTSCHSAKLITQNHLSRDRWEKSIRWMQKNQNLGDLGQNEKLILDYLEKNYGPVKSGRRKPIDKPNWFVLP